MLALVRVPLLASFRRLLMTGTRCRPNVPLCIFRCSLKTLCASASKMVSPKTFARPLVRKRRNPKAALICAKTSSAWMLRFICRTILKLLSEHDDRSIVYRQNSILASDSRRRIGMIPPQFNWG